MVSIPTDNITTIKQLVIVVLRGKKFTYAEIIIALAELIAELANKSVEEDSP